MNTNRIHSLDSLRGVAAFTVVLFHVLLSFEIFYKANYNHQYENFFLKLLIETPLHSFVAGYEAVLLFFVLSGFVLAIPFKKNNFVFSYRHFVLKRFIRIYIPYISVMLISCLLMSLLYEYKIGTDLSETYMNRWDHEITIPSLLAYIFMVNYDTANVNGVVWTLYHEMRVSLIFPFIMLIILRNKPFKAMFFLGLLMVFLIFSFYVPSLFIENTLIDVLLKDLALSVYYSVFFIMGAMLSFYKEPIVCKVSNWAKYNKLALFIASLVFINYHWVFNIVSMPIFALNILAGIGFLMLFVVILSSNLANKILSAKPMLFLGGISYSLYLTHVLVIMTLSILFEQLGLRWIGFMISPIISIPIGYIVYKWFEQPAINLGKKVRLETRTNKFKEVS